MHVDEVAIDAAMVARLISEQFPDLANLAVTRVKSAGTDNAMFRVGEHLAARLPRIHWAAGDVAKEQLWLPRLAPILPLEIPIPIAVGAANSEYPYQWSIYRWLNGEQARSDIVDPNQAARDLARFYETLRAVDSAGAPQPSADGGRGVRLSFRDSAVRKAISELVSVVDVEAVSRAWQSSLEAPIWSNPGVLIHGDPKWDNLLARNGQLSAVIDWGGFGVGDPAVDTMAAFTVFDGEARSTFREAAAIDEATWIRARGWALSVGLIALPYYLNSNPTLAADARRWIDAALADFQGRRRSR
jgi:aminoglycoside phosphotransferase (APT) family kinase protein